MAYFPYFRGKQYELVLIREQAKNLVGWGVSPIVEPVKDNFSALRRVIDSVDKAQCEAWLIVNPKVGALKGRHLHDVPDAKELCEAVDQSQHARWLYQLSEEDDLTRSHAFLAGRPAAAVLHHGDIAAARVADSLTRGGEVVVPSKHFFMHQCGERYRSKFNGAPFVKIEDGFQRKPRNSDYPDDEFFSDALLTYASAGFSGFGDYLIVGREFLEGGGPALTVAIHITYRNPADDGALHIRHFKSVSNETAENPAEKFAEALSELVQAVNAQGSAIQRTTAIEEFLALHVAGHFPGLGYVKKLSMQHHLELLAGS